MATSLHPRTWMLGFSQFSEVMDGARVDVSVRERFVHAGCFTPVRSWRESARSEALHIQI